MLQRTCQLLAFGLALACTANAGAESVNATTSWAAVQPTLATSAYPEQWRLRRASYGQRPIYRPSAGPGSGISRSAPRPLTIAPVSALSVSAVRVGDGDTFFERLEAIRRSPIATLWRGQRTLLVLGFLDGGYLGIRLAESDREE